MQPEVDYPLEVALDGFTFVRAETLAEALDAALGEALAVDRATRRRLVAAWAASRAVWAAMRLRLDTPGAD